MYIVRELFIREGDAVTVVKNYREAGKTIELTFTKESSGNMNGVFLFEQYARISKNITLRYTEGCIHVFIPKGKNDMKIVRKCIEKGREAIRNDEN